MPQLTRCHRLLAGLLLPVFLVVAGMLTSCSKSTSQTQTRRVTAKSNENRKPAPAFTLQDASGASVQLADYRGKVVLLNFWATWCGPCQVEIPWFVEFEQQYKSKGFEVVGVSMDEDGWSAVKPYIASHKINYRILLGNDSVSQLYGGLDALPTTFIIDRDGRVAFPPHIGLPEKNDYSHEIQSLLDEGQSNVSNRAAAPAALCLLCSAK